MCSERQLSSIRSKSHGAWDTAPALDLPTAAQVETQLYRRASTLEKYAKSSDLHIRIMEEYKKLQVSPFHV